jgi:hypothetical protein
LLRSTSISGLFQVGDLRTLISAIRIISQDSLGMLRSRQCPRGYFSAAIGEPGRNVFSLKALHLDGLSKYGPSPPSTIPHHYALIFGVGVRSQISSLRLPPEFPLGVKT